MARIHIDDLPAVQDLSPEELEQIFGAGRSRFRPLGVESLESREMMAANITASLTGGLLSVQDNRAGDQIHIRQVSGQVSVDGVAIQVGATSQSSVAASSVNRIEVHTPAGNDQVWLGDVGNLLTAPTTLLDHVAGDTVFTPRNSAGLTIAANAARVVSTSDGTVFVLDNGGRLQAYNNGTTLVEQSGVRDVSVGIDAGGRQAVFVLESSGLLRTYAGGWTGTVDNGVVQIASGASAGGKSGVFVLESDGDLWSYNAGWTSVDARVRSIAAGVDASNHQAVFVLESDGDLWSYNAGWTHVDAGVRSIAAGTDSGGRQAVFVLEGSGNLWSYNAGWTGVDSKVRSIAAGVDVSNHQLSSTLGS